MNINPKEIKICLDIATSKKAAYLTNHHKPYAAWISVNALLEMTRISHGQIELSFLVDDVDHHIYSFIATTNDGRYEICIVPGKGMTNCWKRFALCKELFHVMLDSESSRCIVLKDHLQDFTSSILGLDVDANESSRNEVMAEFAAMEFLFPYVKRLDSIKDVAAAQNAKDAYIEIAEKFKIPRLLVEEYLGKSRMELFDSISWMDKSNNSGM